MCRRTGSDLRGGREKDSVDEKPEDMEDNIAAGQCIGGAEADICGLYLR